MTAEAIIDKIQKAYDFANSILPGYPVWIHYTNGNFVAFVDISEFSFDDTVSERLSNYGYDDVLFSIDDFENSGLTIEELEAYHFGKQSIKVN